VGSSPASGGGAEASTVAPWHPTLARWPGISGERNSRRFAPTGAVRGGELT
jgi:hypothetical protein